MRSIRRWLGKAEEEEPPYIPLNIYLPPVLPFVTAGLWFTAAVALGTIWALLLYDFPCVEWSQDTRVRFVQKIYDIDIPIYGKKCLRRTPREELRDEDTRMD